MAKPGRGHRAAARVPRFLSSRRDDFYIASDLSDRVFEPVSRSLPHLEVHDLADYSPAVRSTLQDVEDRRNYHPGRSSSSRPAASPRRHQAPTRPVKLFTPGVLEAFKAPQHVAVCVRRKVRDQVLHALKKTGKNSSRKKPRRNQWSYVRC